MNVEIYNCTIEIILKHIENRESKITEQKWQHYILYGITNIRDFCREQMLHQLPPLQIAPVFFYTHCNHKAR